MKRYRIHRVGLQSVAGMGYTLGIFSLLLPALFCGMLTRPLVLGGLGALQRLQSISVGPASVDLVEILGLTRLQGALGALNAAGWWLSAAVTWVICAIAGALMAVLATSGGIGYNLLAWLSGGVEIELRPVDEKGGDELGD